MFFKNILRRPDTGRIPATYMHATLLSYGFFDEVATGLLVIGLPLLRDYLGLSYEQIGLLFATGTVSAMVLEPIINVLSDRHSKGWWILGGLLCLILSYIVAGLFPNYSVLLLVFALFYPAIGTAVGLAEATLIDTDPAGSMATMTRWTLLASIGDVLAPLLVTGLLSVHQGWSDLCLLAACMWSGLFLLTALQPFPRQTAEKSTSEDLILAEKNVDPIEENSKVSTWRALGQAARNPRLLRWGLLALIPTMVDEVLLSFVALYLRDVLHASETIIGFLLTGTLLSSLLGLMLLDRQPWLRRVASQMPHRLLAGMAVVVLAGVFLLLTTQTIWLVGLALAVIGLGAAGWYPIAQAQTYAQLPGRSSLVRAITGLGAPFEAVLPAIVGFLAARFGLLAGLAFLGSAPLLLLLALVGYSPSSQEQAAGPEIVQNDLSGKLS